MPRRSRVLLSSLATLAAVAAAPPARADAGFRAQVLQTLAFAEQQLLESVAEVASPTRFPRSTDPITGRWRTRSASDWTAGFFAGQLWLLFEHSGNPALRSAAEQWTAGVAPQATNTATHDVGFMIFDSAGQAYRITGDDAYRQTVLTAAASLDSRFDPEVGATRSWNNPAWSFPVIIDNLMNLELLLWSSQHGSDPSAMQRWASHARSHAELTRSHHVRADASTFHLVDFDPETGAVLSRETVQGYSDDSTWARGQAWALYGFTMAYRYTHDPDFLATAQALADTFIARLPADDVPYWDFDAPDIPNEPRDSSAAAIAASGLMQLSSFASNPPRRQIYRAAAEAILASLMSSAYLSDGQESSGILLHGTGHKPAGSEIDVSLIYGDYYFVEALTRYVELTPVVPSASAAGLFALATSLLAAALWLLRSAKDVRRALIPSSASADPFGMRTTLLGGLGLALVALFALALVSPGARDGSIFAGWVAPLLPSAQTAATPADAAAAPEPAPAVPEEILTPEAPPQAAPPLITAGALSVLAPDAPEPMVRYVDAQGSVRMVRGLANVPAPYRDKAVVLGRENVNLVDVPASMAVAFRDWKPEANPNRHDVVLWSAPWCGACKNAIRYLDERGIRYEERDIDSDSSAREELVRIVGRIAVPLLQIDGRYVSGYRRDVYDRLMP